MDYQSFQPNPPASQMPQQISLAQKNFTPKFIGVVVGLLVLGGVVSAGLWFWNDKNMETVVPTFTPRVDEVAGWQTYTNTQYGFEFRYPKNHIYQTMDHLGVDSVNFYEGTVDLNQKRFDLSIDSDPLNGADPLTVIKFQPENIISGPDNISVNGKSAQRYKLRWTWQGNSYDYDFVTFELDGKIFTLSDAGLTPDSSLFDQILSTFKFINSVVCIQVITPARNPQTGETRDFPTPCDVPEGWQKIAVQECGEISNSTFESTKEHEVGLGPNGPVIGKWNITFSNNQISWQHSDIAETGTYSCGGNKITAIFPVSGSVIANYDVAKNVLSWQGEKYVKVETNETVCPTPQYTSPGCPKIPTKAKNIKTGETKEFPDGCLPQCWVEIL